MAEPARHRPSGGRPRDPVNTDMPSLSGLHPGESILLAKSYE